MNLNPLSLLQRGAKEFKPGPVIVDRWESETGRDPTTFSPEKYGEYIATSVGVYTCANLRARTLASLPLRFWKGVGDKRKAVESGPLPDLMAKVNPFWTLGRLLRMSELALCLWGQAFWVLERGPTGQQVPREIWWVRPDRMKVLPDPVNYIKGFVLEHQGQKIGFLPSEVIWVRYENPIDEFSGLSPLAAARLSADLNLASLKSNKALFEQGMQPGGLVTPKGQDVTLTPDQIADLERAMERRMKGVDKAHRWLILNGMVTAQPLGISPKDAEFLNQMKWTLEDICRVYQVPLDLVGGQRTYENVDAAQEALWRQCIIPEARFFAEEMSEQLLPMFGGAADEAEFDLSGVAALQADQMAITDQIVKLVQSGVPLNPLLAELWPSLLPESGGYAWGDQWWAPINLLPAGTAPSPEQQGAAAMEGIRDWLRLQGGNGHRKMLTAPEAWAFGSSDHERAWKQVMARTDRQEQTFGAEVRDLFRRQQESVLARLTEERGVKSAEEAAEEPFDKGKWGKIFKASGKPLIEATFVDAAEAALLDLAVGFDFDVGQPNAVRFLERSAQQFARQVNETTWQALKDTLAEGMEAGEGIPKLSSRVKDVFADASDVRAKMIARTEVMRASNGGALEAAKQSKVVKGKRWLTALDERVDETVCMPLHGAVVPLDGDFNGMDAPPAHPRCRCILNWVLEED